ncbi:hypothetical protein [Vibrio splendidus]|uniref:Uncharacterized protein n=2 Tax=Vibrio splendidus TaxID=29497 RepID=A0A2N7JNC3_VIBSP|nr:hypothetical protein [Vibrio splendidus]PMM43606.1 hypothetical protein BCT54_05970 [Vibrio splendidus]
MTDKIDVNKPENARIYRSIPTDEMQSDNLLATIHQWKYVWKNGHGTNTTCDFKELLQYSTKKHVRFLISKFDQSGWAESGKVAYFRDIRAILSHAFNEKKGKQKVELSPESASTYIQAQWFSIRTTGVGLRGRPKKAKTLGWEASKYSSMLKKFGLGAIPKALRNLDTNSASFDSNNYNKKELKKIGRALLSDRKALNKRYRDESISDSQRRLAFDSLINNAVFLYIYYTAAGLTEALNTFVLEDEWKVDNIGGNRISVKGLKTRGYKEETRSFTPRAASKTFFEEHIQLSKLNAEDLKLDKHYLFVRRSGETPNHINLRYYAKGLMERSTTLKLAVSSNPNFKLNCMRLKSSIKQYAESQYGRMGAMESSRNQSESTWNNSEYGKNSKAIARRELAVGGATLYAYAQNPTGGATVAIAKTKAKYCEVLSVEEADALRTASKHTVDDISNGGICKGEDTPQKREFQKTNVDAGLLEEDDVKDLGCGYVIKCFMCRNFAVVDEVHDIWRFLSFELRFKEALIAHKDLTHFIKNFSEVQSSIVEIKKRFKKRNLKAAEAYLKRQGCHPMWDEDSISDVFKG